MNQTSVVAADSFRLTPGGEYRSEFLVSHRTFEGVIHPSVADIFADILFRSGPRPRNFSHIVAELEVNDAHIHAGPVTESWRTMANSKTMTPLPRCLRVSEDGAYSLDHGNSAIKPCAIL